MNKRIVMGIMSILTAATMIGTATFAAFTSAASNEGNTFGAGTLTLTIDGQAGSASTPVFGVTNAFPGMTPVVQSLLLANTGTTTATSVVLTGIDTLDGNIITPPNLANKLTLELFVDDGDNSFEPGTDDTQVGTTQVLSNAQWTGLNLGFGLGSAKRVYLQISFPTGVDDNDYQGESLTFDFNFQASQ